MTPDELGLTFVDCQVRSILAAASAGGATLGRPRHRRAERTGTGLPNRGTASALDLLGECFCRWRYLFPLWVSERTRKGPPCRPCPAACLPAEQIPVRGRHASKRPNPVLEDFAPAMLHSVAQARLERSDRHCHRRARRGYRGAVVLALAEGSVERAGAMVSKFLMRERPCGQLK